MILRGATGALALMVGAIVVTAAGLCTFTPSVAGAGPTSRDSPGSCIAGIVRDAPAQAQLEEDVLTKLPASRTDAEFLKLMQTRPRFRACRNVTVHLRGRAAGHDRIARETVTDDAGKYSFNGLPQGVYQVWAELSQRPAWRGEMRTPMARAMVAMGEYPGPESHQWDGDVYRADLNLRTDLVTVRGRVTDNEGRPLAGVTVTGRDLRQDTPDFETSDGDRWIERRSVTAVTGADGSYELRGLIPASPYRTAGYLNGGNGVDVFREVEAKAEGFAPATRRLPLVSEELLDRARRMRKALSDLERKHRETQPSTKPSAIVDEQPGLQLPNSSGNIITNVDIVLPPDKTPPN